MPPDDPKLPSDPTTIVGAATDISPLTHSGPKPPHERTAAEEAGTIPWEAIAASARFKELLRAKRRFIFPAMIFFIVYYFALPALVGYARPSVWNMLDTSDSLALLPAQTTNWNA